MVIYTTVVRFPDQTKARISVTHWSFKLHGWHVNVATMCLCEFFHFLPVGLLLVLWFHWSVAHMRWCIPASCPLPMG